MADLSKLIADHRSAMAEYDACDDDRWDACKDAINKKIEATTRALLDHRPASLAEVRTKAEFMAAEKAFVEWNDVDVADIISALTPEDDRPRRAGFRSAELMLLGSLVGLAICLLWIWISARAGR